MTRSGFDRTDGAATFQATPNTESLWVTGPRSDFFATSRVISTLAVLSDESLEPSFRTGYVSADATTHASNDEVPKLG